MYTKEVREHFKDPRNVGFIEGADGKGKAGGGERCPDDLAYIWIKVSEGRIQDIKHKTQGCPFAISSSSVTTELVKGRSLDEALRIDEETVSRELGELPERKLDSIVAVEALRRAIEDYHDRDKG